MFSNGEIIEGHDYGAIATIASKLSFTGDKILGFVTGGGDFVLPDEAAVIAFSEKQIPTEVEELKPEDLWPAMGVE